MLAPESMDDVRSCTRKGGGFSLATLDPTPVFMLVDTQHRLSSFPAGFVARFTTGGNLRHNRSPTTYRLDRAGLRLGRGEANLRCRLAGIGKLAGSGHRLNVPALHFTTAVLLKTTRHFTFHAVVTHEEEERQASGTAQEPQLGMS